MNSIRKLLAAFVAASLLSVTAFAASGSPAGTWKWTIQARSGGQGIEQTLKLDLKDGKLTGTLLGAQTSRFQVPDTPIADASFSEGTIKFTVTRELGGNKFTTKYEGRLDGDTIRGSSERAGSGGEPIKRDWVAQRVK